MIKKVSMIKEKIVFIFTEIWNRWSTEVEFKQKINIIYLLNPLHIFTLLWQTSTHLLKDKTRESPIF